MIKNIAVLGSNTSLGIQLLDFFLGHPSEYKIVALSYDSLQDNINVFINQIKKINPRYVYLDDSTFQESIEKQTNVREIFIDQKNFSEFIKSIHIDLIIYALSNIENIKKILSAIYEYKDIIILDPFSILYAGDIIPKDAKLKGIHLNYFSSYLYCLQEFLKLEELSNVSDVFIFFNQQKIERKISSINYNNYYEFSKEINSIYQFDVIYNFILLHYIFEIPPSKFKFLEQTNNFFSIGVRFSNGHNVFNIIDSSFQQNQFYNYYFLKKEFIKTNINSVESFLEKNVSIKKLNINHYKFLKLAISCLEKGGTLPVVYFLTIEIIKQGIYTNKLKDDIDIYNVLSEILSIPEMYNSSINLNVIYVLETKIKQTIFEKYSRKKQK